MRTGFLLAAALACSMMGAVPPTAATTPEAVAGQVAQRPLKGRTLQIAVKGLPKGTKAPLKVTGPHKFKRSSRVVSSWKLKGLRPGRYQVTARSVKITADTWKATVTPASVRITKKKGRKVGVRYVNTTVPVPPGPEPGSRPAVKPVTISAGRDHTCAIDNLGRPWCWGHGTFGQLGDGDTTGTDKWEPVQVTGSLTVTTIAAGGFHTCALAGNQVAWCWGDDNAGELGDNNPTTFTSYQPLMVAGGHAFKAITAGGSHTCALDATGRAWCWGKDEYGQLGDGDADQSDKYAPVLVAGNHTFATISAGWATTCAVDTADQAWCWGNNATGQLGNGDAGHAPKYEPVAVAGGHTFATISAGWDRTCALDPKGAAWCWGQDTFVQTGGSALTGTVTPATVRNEPVAVAGGHTFATLAAGGYHVCAADTAGKAWCWGENQNGQLGDGDTAGADTLEPMAVAGDRTFATITAGGHHSCAIDTNGGAWSWGWYYQGRLGLGEDVKQDQFGPAAVAGGHSFLKP